MAPDLCLIPDSAKRDPNVFLLKRLCYRTGNRCLAGSGRAYETNNGRISLFGKGTNRQILQDSVLYFFQSVMIPVQNLLCILQIHIVPAALIPRHFQKGLYITSADSTVCRVGSEILKTIDLFFDLLFDLIRSFQLFCLFKKAVNIRACCILSKLLPDHLHLFSQDILSLILVKFLPNLAFDLLLNLENRDRLQNKGSRNFIELLQAFRIQDFLLFLKGKGKFRNSVINVMLGLRKSPYAKLDILYLLSDQRLILMNRIHHAFPHGFLNIVIHVIFIDLCRPNRNTVKLFLSVQENPLSTINRLQADPVEAMLQLHDTYYICNDANLVKIRSIRIITFLCGIHLRKNADRQTGSFGIFCRMECSL